MPAGALAICRKGSRQQHLLYLCPLPISVSFILCLWSQHSNGSICTQIIFIQFCWRITVWMNKKLAIYQPNGRKSKNRGTFAKFLYFFYFFCHLAEIWPLFYIRLYFTKCLLTVCLWTDPDPNWTSVTPKIWPWGLARVGYLQGTWEPGSRLNQAKPYRSYLKS